LDHGEDVGAAIERPGFAAEVELPAQYLLTLGVSRGVECFFVLRGEEVGGGCAHDRTVPHQQLGELGPSIEVTLVTAVGVACQIPRLEDAVDVFRPELATLGEHLGKETPRRADFESSSEGEFDREVETRDLSIESGVQSVEAPIYTISKNPRTVK
jgi:hypothetical protein